MKAKIKAQTIAALAIGGALLGSAVTAHADGPLDRTRSISVQYGDLNLSHPAGIEALYQRLRAAAEEVCGPYENTRNVRVRIQWEECYHLAIDDAVANVEQPALARYHFDETGRKVETTRVATTQ